MCSIMGGDATKNVDPESLKGLDTDAVKKSFWESEANQATLSNLASITTLDGSKFDAVMLVGGFGVMFDFYPNEAVGRVGRECYENNGVIAAVCHGPIGLASIKDSNGKCIANGKNVTGFADTEEDVFGLTKYYPKYPNLDIQPTVEQVLKDEGANYTQTENWGKHVVVDGNMVTGQNPASADGVGEEVVKILSSR